VARCSICIAILCFSGVFAGAWIDCCSGAHFSEVRHSVAGCIFVSIRSTVDRCFVWFGLFYCPLLRVALLNLRFAAQLYFMFCMFCCSQLRACFDGECLLVCDFTIMWLDGLCCPLIFLSFVIMLINFHGGWPYYGDGR
jgi:hypothetical protein